MAGGTIVLLGLNLKRGEKLFGTHCASGMHGGKIFVRGLFPKENLSDNIKVTNLDDDDVKELKSYVRKYCKYFGVDFDYVMSKPFKKLVRQHRVHTQIFIHQINKKKGAKAPFFLFVFIDILNHCDIIFL